MLQNYLYEVLDKGDGFARVRLLPQSPIFAAHFPGFPVTPGVTLVQIALELMGRRLLSARNIKFIVPIFPSPEGPVLCFKWSFPAPSRVDVAVYVDGETLSVKMILGV